VAPRSINGNPPGRPLLWISLPLALITPGLPVKRRKKRPFLWGLMLCALFISVTQQAQAQQSDSASLCEIALPASACLEPGLASLSLRDLDASARKGVQDGQLRLAEVQFACLLRRDLIHEHAMNLGLVRSSQGNNEGAYLALGCAVALAPNDTLREQLRQKQQALPLTQIQKEQLQAIRPMRVVPAPEVSLPKISATPAPSSNLASSKLSWLPETTIAHVAAPTSIVTAVCAAAFFALASDRAQSFNDEQDRMGFSSRAVDLRSESHAWQTASLVSLGIAITSGVIAGLTWRN
jgi:hypothetical protein